MKFIINEEQRQHINLSKRAMAVIEKDMIKFNDDYTLKNKSGFINRIITNYFDTFPLSRTVALKQVDAIEKAIKNDNFRDKLANQVIETFSNEIYKNLIHEYKDKYTYDLSFKLKLNKENIEILETLEEADKFESYAPRSGLGFYLKIILESYAELNSENRQRVYYKKLINELEQAITESRLVVFKNNENVEKVCPYIVYKPKNKEMLELSYYNLENPEEEIYLIRSIKIKNLKDKNLRVLKERNKYKISYFDILEKKETETLGPVLDFVLEFTPNGLKRFLYEEDKIDIIGIPKQDNMHIYTFHTTETKIFIHFFKYGSQVKIIEPEETGQRFKMLYKKAYEVYENN